MSIVPSVSDNEQEISDSITRFICDFKVGSLLKQCGCKKEKGIAFMKLFTYILCNVFRDRSMYMQKKTGSFKEDFSKNAYYRFFRNAHANWLRFTALLSEKIINGIFVISLQKIVWTVSSLMIPFMSASDIRRQSWHPKSLTMSA